MRTMIAVLTMSAMTIAVFAAKGDESTQNLHVTKGAEYSYSVKSNNTNTTTMMGNENVTTFNATMKGSVKATDVSKDSLAFSVDLRNADIAVTGMSFFGMPDTTFHYDDLKAAQEMIIVAPNGKVLRRDHKRTDAPQGGESMIIRQLSGARNPLHNMFMSFPDGALTTGRDWSVSSIDTNDQGMGKVVTTLSMRYTFDGTIDTLGMKCGRISGKSVKFIVSGTMKQMGREVNVDGDGIISSRYIYELKTGLPVTIINHTQMDQRISIGEGMEIPTSSDITSTIQRTMP